jgi:hypothetical protein
MFSRYLKEFEVLMNQLIFTMGIRREGALAH